MDETGEKSAPLCGTQNLNMTLFRFFVPRRGAVLWFFKMNFVQSAWWIYSTVPYSINNLCISYAAELPKAAALDTTDLKAQVDELMEFSLPEELTKSLIEVMQKRLGVLGKQGMPSSSRQKPSAVPPGVPITVKAIKLVLTRFPINLLGIVVVPNVIISTYCTLGYVLWYPMYRMLPLARYSFCFLLTLVIFHF